MILTALFGVACGDDEGPPSTTEGTTESTSTGSGPAAPPAIEPISAPELNMAKVLLGRRLFHDTRLSGDGTLSCASCHSLDVGGAEHRAVSTGIRGQQGPINAPTVLNSGLNFVQFWDGRAEDLEAQAAGPVANPLEMGASWDTVVATLRASESDVAEFAPLYPDGITQDNVTDAIAEYERSLVTPSRFDAFLRGDASAITAEEQRGWATFQEVGCTACHRGPNAGGSMYQRMGLVRNYFELRGTPLTEVDNGRYNVTHDDADRHRFKVPSLRNVELTAPYFHDGSQAELSGAVRIMGQVQLGRDLTDAQVNDIVAFLRSLTGNLPEHARPPASAPTAPTPTAPAPTGPAPTDPTTTPAAAPAPASPTTAPQ